MEIGALEGFSGFSRYREKSGHINDMTKKVAPQVYACPFIKDRRFFLKGGFLYEKKNGQWN